MKIEILITILLCLMSYLYGSIPFALVIGKLFFNKDIRNYGSGNLGGTNATRVLGNKVGFLVIILDATKCIVSILITRYVCHLIPTLSPDIQYLSAACCVIGHCYPIFAGFRGGKAVSTSVGYLLITNIYDGIIGILIFISIVKKTKYVSLGSISVALLMELFSFFYFLPSPFNILGYSPIGIIANTFIVFILVYKHKPNIERLKNGTESEIHWFDKK